MSKPITLYDDIPAGTELDKLCAEKLFGWTDFYRGNTSNSWYGKSPRYPSGNSGVWNYSELDQDNGTVHQWLRDREKAGTSHSTIARVINAYKAQAGVFGDPWLWLFFDADFAPTLCRVALTLASMDEEEKKP